MRMRKKFFPLVIILIGVFLFGVSFVCFFVIEQSKITTIEKVDAFVAESKKYPTNPPYTYPEYINDTVKIQSFIPNLYVLIDEIDIDNDSILMTVYWNKLKKQILIKTENEWEVQWRPNRSGFVYAQYLGEKEILKYHYVMVTKDHDSLKVKDSIIFKKKDDNNPNFCWSQNGRYLIYPNFASFTIFEIDTGRSWSPKTIVIHAEKKNLNINWSSYTRYSSTYWVNNGKYLLYNLDEFPLDCGEEIKTVATGLIDLKQFKLGKD